MSPLDPDLCRRLAAECREEEPRPLLMRAVEAAVDAALAELARQQGGIALPTGRAARCAGISAGRAVLRQALRLIMPDVAAQLTAAAETAVEVASLREEVSAGDQRLAGVLDGTFATGDGTAQEEIERLRSSMLTRDEVQQAVRGAIHARVGGTIHDLGTARVDADGVARIADHVATQLAGRATSNARCTACNRFRPTSDGEHYDARCVCGHVLQACPASNAERVTALVVSAMEETPGAPDRTLAWAQAVGRYVADRLT